MKLFHGSTWHRYPQLIVVLFSALTLKLCYSTAGPNQLRWILTPTTFLVELVSGTPFTFEANAGYLSGDRSFLIAGSCAGVNFLITAFLMLSLRKLWKDSPAKRSQNQSPNLAWTFIPAAALFAYLATLVANTVRISTALLLRQTPLEIGWLSGNQLHRFEGIFIYFGFLLLLFMVCEKSTEKALSLKVAQSSESGMGFKDGSRLHNSSGWLRQSLFPLLIYYAITLGIPLANGAHRQGADFWEHSLFVLLTPLLLILPLATFRFYRHQRAFVQTPLSSSNHPVNGSTMEHVGVSRDNSR